MNIMNEAVILLERRDGPYGEVALRRRGERFEIIANGCFLMDTSDGRSERLLISAALDALANSQSAHILIGGLGVGFSLSQAAADPRPGRIVVVEREQAIIDWHTAGTTGEAPLAPFAAPGHTDPRTRIVHDDLLHYLRTADEQYDALCLDVDNGPDWTVTDDNQSVYGAEGLALLGQALSTGGVLAVWSASRPRSSTGGCAPGSTRSRSWRYRCTLNVARRTWSISPRGAEADQGCRTI